MVMLKSILYALLGAAGGFLSGVVSWIPAHIVTWFVAGINSSNYWDVFHTTWNTLIWLAIIGGGLGGFFIPIKEENQKREREEEKEREIKKQQDENIRRAKEAAREASIAHEREMEYKKTQLAKLLSDSIEYHKSIPQTIRAANKHLNSAASEFTEGAFAPFWDAIERATKEIAYYHKYIETISRNAISYKSDSDSYSIAVPPFRLPARELPDARPTVTRLQTLVRAAQKDFHFATIYEQRKTNKILVEGFSTLGSALYSLGDVISSSLSELSTNLRTSLDEILSETARQTDQLQVQSDKYSGLIANQIEMASKNSTRQREFEAETIEILEEQKAALDNIQRGRKP